MMVQRKAVYPSQSVPGSKRPERNGSVRGLCIQNANVMRVNSRRCTQ